MTTMLHTLVCAFVFLLASVHAIPLKARDVVDPPITSPDASTVWKVGTTQTVTWDTSSLPPPANITNSIGKVILGFLTADSENLMLDTPLAQGFPITQGSVDITVPDVPPRTNYIVVLMGDSGNASPEFSIIGGSAASSSSSSSSTPSAPPSSTPGSGASSLTPTSPGGAGAPAPTPTSTPSVSPDTLANNSPSSTSSSQSTLVVPAGSSTSTVSPSPTPPSGASSNAAWSWKQTHISSIVFAFMAVLITI